jgi:aspartate ammonia-lyase
MPLVAEVLLENLTLLERAVTLFRLRCIETLAPDAERCASLLDGSVAFAASYAPILGYDRVARIVEEHRGDAERIRAELQSAAKLEEPLI